MNGSQLKAVAGLAFAAVWVALAAVAIGPSASAQSSVVCRGKSKPVHGKLRYWFTCYGSFDPTDIGIFPKAPPRQDPHGILPLRSASRVHALNSSQSASVDIVCHLERLRKGSFLNCPTSSRGPNPVLGDGVTATGTMRLAAPLCSAHMQIEMGLPQGVEGIWNLRRTGCARRHGH